MHNRGSRDSLERHLTLLRWERCPNKDAGWMHCTAAQSEHKAALLAFVKVGPLLEP
jgi:hypothetical protein